MPPPSNHFVRYGLPFLTFMVLGHRGLTHITAGRYQLRDEMDTQQALMTSQNKVVLPPPTPPEDYVMVSLRPSSSTSTSSSS